MENYSICYLRGSYRIPAIYFTSILLFLIGCTPKPLLIDIDPPDPKIVVSSQVIPDHIMLVSLSRSFSALDFVEGNDEIDENFINDLIIDEGLVVISYLNESDTLFSIGYGLYASLNTPQYADVDYMLYAYDSILEESVTATELMLPLVPFDTIYPTITKSSADTTIELTYTLSDPQEENFYMINVYSRFAGVDSSGLDIYSYFNNGGNLLVKTRLISDKTFSSSTIAETFELDDNITVTDTISVTISNISKQYYNYLSKRNKSTNWFSDITNEPINYPTNINGGYGFFTTHHPDIVYFDLNQF